MTDFPKARDEAAEAFSEDLQKRVRSFAGEGLLFTNWPNVFKSGANWAYQLFWLELTAKRQEIDRLKASLRLLEEECDRKDAEIERLQAERTGVLSLLAGQAEEIEHFRAALEGK